MVLVNKSLKNKIFYTAEGNLKFDIYGVADRQLSEHYEQNIVKGMHGFSIKHTVTKKPVKSKKVKTSKTSKSKTTTITTSMAPDSKYLIQ